MTSTPPEPFTYPVVLCPACAHGIDPHGTDPGGWCGVGDAAGVPCLCLWSPNDIAAHREAEVRERLRERYDLACRDLASTQLELDHQYAVAAELRDAIAELRADERASWEIHEELQSSRIGELLREAADLRAKVEALNGILTAKFDGGQDVLLWRSEVIALLKGGDRDRP